MAKLIELRDVYKIYSEGLESEVRALDGVSLTIDRGEFVAIVGQSGSGKSTMMNVLGCLDVPTYGEYLLEGTDVSELSDMQLSRIRNKEIGFIFQQYNLIQSLSVQENVELPLVYQGIGIDDRHELAIEALERVGLVDRRRNKPTQMSGGQQQRVAIARAISTRPPIIMADEPTGALDSKTGHEVLQFLQQLNKEGSTVILITHDNGIAATARRCVRLADARSLTTGSRRWIGCEHFTGLQNGVALHHRQEGPQCADDPLHLHRHRRRHDHRFGHGGHEGGDDEAAQRDGLEPPYRLYVFVDVRRGRQRHQPRLFSGSL